MLTYHNAYPSASVDGVQQSYLDDPRYQARTIHQDDLDVVETSKSRDCLKKTTKFLFSHIGLVGLVVVYAVAGGFLFQLLETRQEKINCQEKQAEQSTEMTRLKQEIVYYIQTNATPSEFRSINEIDNTSIAFEKIQRMLFNYRDFVIRSSANYRSYEEDCSTVNKWTYPNSLLFAITIITTIGYGNITPMTSEGQLCCICFATIGIPIFFLCVANISGVLGEMFRFLYSKILCGPCSFVKKRRAQARKAKLEEESGMSTDRTHTNGWKLDDENPANFRQRLSKTFFSNTGEIDEDEARRNQRVAVPLTVTMIIIAAYIYIGAAIFHNFEEWSMMQSGYFCFITLATIGFGDFVPGQRREDRNSGGKLILGAIYALFGMAILAMCFDLMQEEIVAKFKWIGTKMGLVEKIPENNEINEKMSDTRTKTRSSILESNTSINRQLTKLDPSTQRNSSATRKSSPTNNIARVHPANEGTLHQRVSVNKPY